jgi:hypothetical protein
MKMKKTYFALFILFSMCNGAFPQEQAPPLLTQAAHCLKAKDFLPLKATSMFFGYLVDKDSYPGEKVIYVVEYPSPTQTGGFVFAIFLTEKGEQRVFNIQNNARFILSKKEMIGVDFVDPPLGGTWTQEHLVSAIKQIEKRQRFLIPVQNLLEVPDNTQCEAYTDSLDDSVQPKEDSRQEK